MYQNTLHNSLHDHGFTIQVIQFFIKEQGEMITNLTWYY